MLYGELFIIAFLVSVFTTGLILISGKYHSKLTYDYDLTGVQKYHTKPTPRIGGVPILLSIIACSFFLSFFANSVFDVSLIVPLVIIFLAGFLEDITKKITPLFRTCLFLIATLLAIYVTNTLPIVTNTGFNQLNHIVTLYPILGLGLSMFCVIGLTNAYNIIDGYNGLAIITAISNLFGLLMLAFIVNNIEIIKIIIMLGAIIGLFIFNYPLGKIFLGDSGAYSIGFMIAVLSICLVHTTILGAISPYAVLLLAIYPITEIGFSIYRKKILRKTLASQPDGLHFHMLIYKRCIKARSKYKNSLVVATIFPFYILPQTILGCIFYKDTLICLLLILFFIVFYLVSYFKIVRFKSFSFLRLF